MMPCFGMHLGFTEIAPPSANTFFGELVIAFGEPIAGFRIADIKYATITDSYCDIVRAAKTVGDKHAAPGKGVVIVETTSVAQHIRLRYDYRVDTFLL